MQKTLFEYKIKHFPSQTHHQMVKKQHMFLYNKNFLKVLLALFYLFTFLKIKLLWEQSVYIYLSILYFFLLGFYQHIIVFDLHKF